MGNTEPKITAVTTLSEATSKDRSKYYGTWESNDENAIPNDQNPFLDPEIAEYWTGVYEKAQYECRHVFDPALTWSAEEEKQLIRKLDWRICLWAVCTMSLLFLRFKCLSLLLSVLVRHVLRSPGRSRKPRSGGF